MAHNVYCVCTYTRPALSLFVTADSRKVNTVFGDSQPWFVVSGAKISAVPINILKSVWYPGSSHGWESLSFRTNDHPSAQYTQWCPDSIAPLNSDTDVCPIALPLLIQATILADMCSLLCQSSSRMKQRWRLKRIPSAWHRPVHLRGICLQKRFFPYLNFLTDLGG